VDAAADYTVPSESVAAAAAPAAMTARVLFQAGADPARARCAVRSGSATPKVLHVSWLVIEIISSVRDRWRRSSAQRGSLPSVVPPISVRTVLARHGEVRQDRTVTAYLGGPPWPELDAALARRDLPGALGLAEHSAEVDLGERQLVTGICRSVFHQGDLAAEALLQSFRTFCQNRPMRAAVSAVLGSP
jgi:hypothetical protein